MSPGSHGPMVWREGTTMLLAPSCSGLPAGLQLCSLGLDHIQSSSAVSHRPRNAFSSCHKSLSTSVPVSSCTANQYGSLCRSGCGFLQQLVDQRLIGLLLLCCHLSKLTQEFRRKPDGNELLRHAACRSADPAHTLEFVVRRLRNV